MSQCADLFARIESPSDYKEGVDRVAGYFVEKAQARGWKTEVLEQWKDKDGLTCSCGILQGGTAVNTVPEKCQFQVDVRFRTYAQEQEAEAFMRQLASHSYVEGSSCTLTRISRRVPMERNDKNLALLDSLNAIYAQEGLETLTAVQGNGGSDAADMTGYGIPCLDSLGIPGGSFHSIKEWASLPGLGQSAKYLAAAAYCL